MQVAEPDLDLADRFTVETDPSSEPVDADRIVARFLIRLVRNGKQSRSSDPGGVECTHGPDKQRHTK